VHYVLMLMCCGEEAEVFEQLSTQCLPVGDLFNALESFSNRFC
jgi:hypothetical protein